MTVLPSDSSGQETPPRQAAPESVLKVLLLENIHASATELFDTDTYRPKSGGAIRFRIERLSKSLPMAELCQRVRDVHLIGIRSKTRITAEVIAAAPELL